MTASAVELEDVGAGRPASNAGFVDFAILPELTISKPVRIAAAARSNQPPKLRVMSNDMIACACRVSRVAEWPDAELAHRFKRAPHA